MTLLIMGQEVKFFNIVFAAGLKGASKNFSGMFFKTRNWLKKHY